MNNKEEFLEKAQLNGIKVVEFKDIKEELISKGYNGEDYLKNGNIGIIKAIAANSKEGNVLIDVSDQDKLKAVIDIETLYVIINEHDIKSNMFEAYKSSNSNSNYLIFVGAESKTADIEKQLVSGVQGAKKLVFVLE